MHRSFLPLLRCPICRGPLAVAETVQGSDGCLEWGLLSCRCREPHAVVAGIPLLLPALDPRGIEARTALRTPHLDHEAWLAEACRRWMPSLPPLAPRPTALEAIAEAGGGVFYEYLAWKWATRSFATGVTLLGAAPRGVLVDLGCGMGHLAWTAGHLRAATKTIAVDHALPLLLAGRALGLLPAPPHGLAVCADANFGLPVVDGTAATVFVSDGLHYFFRARAVVADAHRALAPDGVLILNHLHNRHATAGEPAQGHSRAPDEWSGQVQHAGFGWQALFADDDLLQAVAMGDVPPHRLPFELAAARSLSMLAGSAPRAWSPGVLPDEGPLALNPVYGFAPARDAAHRAWPSAAFADEHGSPLFPATVTWPATASPDERRALVARLTWLPLPSGYVGAAQYVDSVGAF
ncbi:MAG: methyltransferase domain-containing protein [Vicinamibacterales bacterium]